MTKPGAAYEAVVVGVSAGGMQLVKTLVTSMPADFGLAVIVVQHVGENGGGEWPRMLNEWSSLHVKEADEKEPIRAGTVYLAPPGYHLLVETDRTFTLTADERVNHARPSIDVLFETAADAYREKLVGIVMSGAGSDGARGLLQIRQGGGLTVVQDPLTAEYDAMPQAAITIAAPDHILSPQNILALLLDIQKEAAHYEPEN